MCNGKCDFFEKIFEQFFYCQDCRKFVGESNLFRENKEFGRRRCSCCNGLVRTKAKVFSKLKNAQPTVNYK